ncbi:MAG: hypothetical protein QNJ98_17985 [Planctomycetota bacterium]|nr:hypothetical protein [Planctomycetota bacterium]
MTTLDAAVPLTADLAPETPARPSVFARATAAWRRNAFGVLAPMHLLAIAGIPAALVWFGIQATSGLFWGDVVVVLSPVFFALAYGFTAAALSRLHQKGYARGRFVRDLTSKSYGRRRLYGLCWTAVYYAPAIYHLFLAIPVLKKALFRLYGYRGEMGFTTYPDTWIRDIPLLTLGEGAYLSNKATIGTNIVMSSGHLLVDGVTIERGGLVGHLAMIGPGTVIGEKAELGVGAALGIRTKLGKGAKVGARCTIEHGVRIGEGAVIGIQSFVGTRCVIGEGVIIPPASVIPARTILRTQDDVRALLG